MHLVLLKNYEVRTVKYEEGTMKYESKKEGKDQEAMQSSATPNPGHHMKSLWVFKVMESS